MGALIEDARGSRPLPFDDAPSSVKRSSACSGSKNDRGVV